MLMHETEPVVAIDPDGKRGIGIFRRARHIHYFDGGERTGEVPRRGRDVTVVSLPGLPCAGGDLQPLVLFKHLDQRIIGH